MSKETFLGERNCAMKIRVRVQPKPFFTDVDVDFPDMKERHEQEKYARNVALERYYDMLRDNSDPEPESIMVVPET